MSEPVLYASDLPPWLPEEWRTAANRLLATGGHLKHRPDLLRILRDTRMRNVCDVFDKRFSASEGLSEKQRVWVAENERLGLLFFMVSKGGPRPTETAGQTKARRKRIARTLRAAIEALASDDVVARIDVGEALHWNSPLPHGAAELVRRFIKADGETEIAPSPLVQAPGHLSPPSLSKLLGAVAERLESGAYLSGSDPLLLIMPFTVQPGRGVQAHIENTMARHYRRRNELPVPVIASIIEVSLDLAPGSIDVAELADRMRKILR
jgi:hypothetical protein